MPDEMSIILSNELSNVAAQTTLDLQGLIASMRTSGMSDSAIKATLMSDLTSGGRLFGNYRNGVKNTVKSGIGRAGNIASEGRFFSAGVNEFRWVTASSKPCPDCERRHGETGTMEYWRTAGKPRSGFSVCQSSCQCQLIPVGYNGENLDKPLVRGEKKAFKGTPDARLNKILSKANVSPKKALDDMMVFAKHNTPESVMFELAEEYGIKGADAHHFVNYVRDLPEDLERYLKTTPSRLGGFDHYMEKWTRGVEVEGRDGAAMTFWDFEDVRDYTQAELIVSLREHGHNIKSLDDFRKSKHKLYRSGATQHGYNSFFMNKEQAISYQRRFGVDSVSEYEVYGYDIIPTRSGAGEVVVRSDAILSETIIDIGL